MRNDELKPGCLVYLHDAWVCWQLQTYYGTGLAIVAGMHDDQLVLYMHDAGPVAYIKGPLKLLQDVML